MSWSFHAWHAMSTQHSKSEALPLRDMRCLAYEGLLREAGWVVRVSKALWAEDTFFQNLDSRS